MNVENQTSNQAASQAMQQLSALMDGELSASELDDLLSSLSAPDDDEACYWAVHSYQHIGQAMRADRGLSCSSVEFLNALNAKIAQEPPLMAVEQPQIGEVPVPQLSKVLPATSRQEVANQSVFRWKMVAGLASVAAVAMVGWNSMALLGADKQPAGSLQQMASAVVSGADNRSTQSTQGLVQMPVTVGQNATVMLRDPRLDELLAARGQIGGAANLQMPASFLRNATFTAEKKADCAEKASLLC